MNFYVMTLFPEMIEENCNHSILKRAIDQNLISVTPINIRDFSTNKHKKVDDYTYGGGAGMLMEPEPVYLCYENIIQSMKKKPKVIFMSPQGTTLNQKKVKELAKEDDLILLCGHYEGIDQRVLDQIVDEEISIGDYVLTGGELSAMVVIDSVSRYAEGVLSNSDSTVDESFSNGLLEYPQYTRPSNWRGIEVPEVLLSGNHKKIEQWRAEQSLINTKNKRPDLLQ